MSQGRYVWIAGKKVYLNPELQKEWDKLINKRGGQPCFYSQPYRLSDFFRQKSFSEYGG
mgnify:FL=1